VDASEYLCVGVFYPYGYLVRTSWVPMGIYGDLWGSMGIYGGCLQGSLRGGVWSSVRIWKRTSKGSWEDLTEDLQTPTGHSPGPKAVVRVVQKGLLIAS